MKINQPLPMWQLLPELKEIYIMYMQCPEEWRDKMDWPKEAIPSVLTMKAILMDFLPSSPPPHY
jgi:hypothetical protein